MPAKAGIHVFATPKKDMDGRDIGERSDAVLRTAKPGHDGGYVLSPFKNCVRFVPAPIMKARSAPAIKNRQPRST